MSEPPTLTPGMLVRRHGRREQYRVVEPAPTLEGEPQGWWMIGLSDGAAGFHAFHAGQVRPVVKSVKRRRVR